MHVTFDERIKEIVEKRNRKRSRKREGEREKEGTWSAYRIRVALVSLCV